MSLQSTRPIYDLQESQRQSILQQRPLRYVTENYRVQRLLKESHPEDIGVSSGLRAKPTSLNYYSRQNTELYGTSAYFGGGMQEPGQEITIDSGLRYGESSNRTRIITESQFPAQGVVQNTPVHVDFDNDLRFSSTRADARNRYR